MNTSETSKPKPNAGRMKTINGKGRMPPLRRGRRTVTTKTRMMGTPSIGSEKGDLRKCETRGHSKEELESEEECQEIPQANPWIADVDSCIRNDQKSVMEIASTEQDWERITLKIDSGAVDTVMPPTIGKHFPLEETERSKKGEGYLAANNTVIPHYGMRKLKGQSDAYQPMSMIAQVAGVKSTLVSVSRLLEAGNRVHFEPGNCYVEHAKSGKRTRIIERNGAFEVGFWVPRAKGEQTKTGVVNEQGFARQDVRA